METDRRCESSYCMLRPGRIPRPGERFDLADGPPAGAERPLIQDADFCTIAYGLLSLAAQALRAGHRSRC
jgi:hypothetical protein